MSRIKTEIRNHAKKKILAVQWTCTGTWKREKKKEILSILLLQFKLFVHQATSKHYVAMIILRYCLMMRTGFEFFWMISKRNRINENHWMWMKTKGSWNFFFFFFFLFIFFFFLKRNEEMSGMDALLNPKCHESVSKEKKGMLNKFCVEKLLRYFSSSLFKKKSEVNVHLRRPGRRFEFPKILTFFIRLHHKWTSILSSINFKTKTSDFDDAMHRNRLLRAWLTTSCLLFNVTRWKKKNTSWRQ